MGYVESYSWVRYLVHLVQYFLTLSGSASPGIQMVLCNPGRNMVLSSVLATLSLNNITPASQGSFTSPCSI